MTRAQAGKVGGLCFGCLVVLSVLFRAGLVPVDVATVVSLVLAFPACVTVFLVSLPSPGQEPGEESDARGWAESRMPGAAWRVASTLVTILLVLPTLLVILVTQGDSGSALTRLFSNRPLLQSYLVALDSFPLLLVAALIAALPEYLRSKGRARNTDSSVPGWLAGLASVATVAYVLLLHFDGGILGKADIGVLSVAAVGVATLLAPLYKAIASACLNDGIMHVFDPWRWWSEWCHAYREMTGRIPDALTPAEEPGIAIPHAAHRAAGSGSLDMPTPSSETVQATGLSPDSGAG